VLDLAKNSSMIENKNHSYVSLQKSHVSIDTPSSSLAPPKASGSILTNSTHNPSQVTLPSSSIAVSDLQVNANAIVPIKGSRYVGRSFSTMISNLGHSVKKVFKKKSRYSESQHYNRLMKTMSVQHNLAYHDRNTSDMSSCSSLVSLGKKIKLVSHFNPSDVDKRL
jgi:hypothetical protein